MSVACTQAARLAYSASLARSASALATKATASATVGAGAGSLAAASESEASTIAAQAAFNDSALRIPQLRL